MLNIEFYWEKILDNGHKWFCFLWRMRNKHLGDAKDNDTLYLYNILVKRDYERNNGAKAIFFFFFFFFLNLCHETRSVVICFSWRLELEKGGGGGVRRMHELKSTYGVRSQREKTKIF